MTDKEPTEEQPKQAHVTFKSIMGGDILAHNFLRRQANLRILMVILTILYIDKS